MKLIDKRKKLRRQYPFRRKSDENAFEALERLDKKLSALIDDRRHWLFRASAFAISIVNRLEEEYKTLIGERRELISEINGRHKKLVAIADNVISL